MTLLDTSVIIDYLTGDQKIVEVIQEIAKTQEIKTTTITEYELLRHRNKIKKQAAEKFLSAATIYPFNSPAAQQAARLFETSQNAGRTINENDLLIAGITLANGEVLLTRDKKFANLNQPNIQII